MLAEELWALLYPLEASSGTPLGCLLHCWMEWVDSSDKRGRIRCKSPTMAWGSLLRNPIDGMQGTGQHHHTHHEQRYLEYIT